MFQKLIVILAGNSWNEHLKFAYREKKILRDGESNPGLPRDRRGYSPLYYRGDVRGSPDFIHISSNQMTSSSFLMNESF